MALRSFAALGILSLVLLGCGSSDSTEPGFQSTGDAGIDAQADVGSDASADVSADTGPDAHADAAEDAKQDASDTGADAGCALPPACDAPLPSLGDPRDFRHTSSTITAAIGSPRHRGRDLFILEGDDAWVLGKFSYGVLDDDIKDEDVDVYLLRDCGDTWTFVGTYLTTYDGDHATVHDVEDTGGRIYVNLTDEGIAPLARGRHRILMVVGGDLSYTEQFIEVLHPDAKVVVTDIDGTLTSSEYAALTDVIGMPPADVHPGAPEMMNAFAQRGYHLFYLTARPEWMMPLSREWIPLRGFPPGVLHTTLSKAGALGGAAVTYKSGELAWLKTHTGIVPSYGFGNKDSDVEAYVGGGIEPSNCYYYALDSDLQGGTNHEDYNALVSMAEAAPTACW